jgi:hypothetical protein
MGLFFLLCEIDLKFICGVDGIYLYFFWELLFGLSCAVLTGSRH